MTRGERISIPILGINTRSLDDQSIDGQCDSIVNLKPKGEEERPYWVPFEKIETLRNDADVNFSYEFGLNSITNAFWQVRNYIGEYSQDPNGSLRRLLVLCQNSSRKCIDIIEPDTWTVVKTQALPLSGTYEISCTRVDEVTVIAISRDKRPYLLYYLLDDAFIPQGWPEMPDITFSTDTVSFTTPEVEAGTTEGVLRKAASDQFFMVTWAFRLFDGTHVRHNRFELVKVASGTVTNAVRPIFTLNGYDESILVNQPFWSSLISGISVFATLPTIDQKAALDDGKFYEVGYWSTIDRIPEDQWPTAEDPNIIIVKSRSETWPALRLISLDNLTHHRYSSFVVDSYNKRLLLGGSGVDFTLPKIKTNAFANTIPAGVYSDYLNYNSGFSSFTAQYFDSFGSPVPSPDDPSYNYEINNAEYTSEFNPKTGREFKTVEILASSPNMGTNTPPGGGSDLPNFSRTAYISAGKLIFEIETNQTNWGSGGQFPAQEPWMDIRLTIGPIGESGDQILLFRVSPVGNTAPIVGFSSFLLETSGEYIGPKVYHKITIKTDSGTYYRILEGNISETDTEVTLPEVIWYPDRRAVKYELIVQNGEVFELALSKQLIQHPISNYSYVILTTPEQTYEIGTSILSTDEPDMALNAVIQYVPSRAQAALSGNPFLIDIAATYPVGNRERDIIMGFAINITPTSEGQAGQYPVYVLTNKGIWALEQIGDPTIAFGRITQISNFNGLNNPYSYCNAQNLIIAADNKYIYALAGLNAERIDDAISNDPDYKDFIRQMRVGYHRASSYEEVIFSNPFYDYSLHFNLRYRMWYKSTERYKFFFYDYPELMGMTMANELKNFELKDEETPVEWIIQTRPIILNKPYSLKRLYHSTYLRMQMKQPLQENAEDYFPINIEVIGYRHTAQQSWQLLNQEIKANLRRDWILYLTWGPMYAYRLKMSGKSQNSGSYFHRIDCDIEVVQEEDKRRYECGNDFMYSEDPAAMSLCCCDVTTSKNYYVYPGYINEEEFTIPASVHGFTREPDVTLRDIEGYTFEAPVRVHPTTFDITILVQPSIPYRVLLT